MPCQIFPSKRFSFLRKDLFRFFQIKRFSKRLAKIKISLYNNNAAEIAQLVEHFTRNEGVEGSSPFFSFIKIATILMKYGSWQFFC